jgi:hypothetical protein
VREPFLKRACMQVGTRERISTVTDTC